MSSTSRPVPAVPGWIVNQDATARRMCLIGLIFSFLVSLTCLIYGIVDSRVNLHSQESWGFFIPANAKYLIPLALNGVITLCTECLGFIHSTPLKWALFSDESLEYNANLRLFTFSKNSWPNGRACNIAYLLGLSLCYASAPAIIYDDTIIDGTEFSTTGPGFIYLGLGLLTMCSISLWSFCGARHLVRTWSSHPLNVGAAVTSQDPEFRREERCMHSVHDGQHTTPLKPEVKQRSAYEAHRQVAFVLWAEFAAFAILVLWVSLTIPFIQFTHGSWSFIPGPAMFRFTPQVSLGFLSVMYGDDAYIWLQVPFSILFQSIVTIGMHCAELLVTVSRDEAAWRAVATTKGSNTSPTSAIFAFFSWETLTLTLLKPFIHWVYGLAVYTDYDGLHILVPQLVYLTAIWGVFLVFVTYISLRKPKGPLPATYGHLQTLADLVDEWHGTMFWGHKSEAEDGICHAGTSDEPLPKVRMDALYKG